MNEGMQSAHHLTLLVVVPHGFMCIGLGCMALRMGSCFTGEAYPPGTAAHGRGLVRTLVGWTRSFRPSVPTSFPSHALQDGPRHMVGAEPVLVE